MEHARNSKLTSEHWLPSTGKPVQTLAMANENKQYSPAMSPKLHSHLHSLGKHTNVQSDIGDQASSHSRSDRITSLSMAPRQGISIPVLHEKDELVDRPVVHTVTDPYAYTSY